MIGSDEDALVAEVPGELIPPGANGYSEPGIGFVREELPEVVKTGTRYHEVGHLMRNRFGATGDDLIEEEFDAAIDNISAMMFKYGGAPRRFSRGGPAHTRMVQALRERGLPGVRENVLMDYWEEAGFTPAEFAARILGTK